MNKVSYFIGEDIPSCTTRKTKSIYLYRTFEPENGGAFFERIARFSSYESAKKFASEFYFPLSENIKTILEGKTNEQSNN